MNLRHTHVGDGGPITLELTDCGGASDGADPFVYAPFSDQMSPLGQAVLEPPHEGKRPHILALLEQEELAQI